jgi:uncharacterized membrane protein
MEKKADKSLRQWFKRTLFAGLAALVPLALTVYIINLIISTADDVINRLPASLQPPLDWRFPGSGLVAGVVIALTAGVIARNFIGHYFVELFNRLMERIPLIASLYKVLRQLSEALLSTDDKKGFKKAVLVEWPRLGCWTIAFAGAEAAGVVAAQVGAGDGVPFLNLFIPTTPNPTSGFFMVVKASDVRPLPMSVEAALKLVISGGTLPPEVSPSSTKA